MNRKKLIFVCGLLVFLVSLNFVSATDGYYHNVKKSKYTSISAEKIISKYPKTNIKAEKTGVVTKVIDGDTIDVTGVGRIRLSQVDTPEKRGRYKGWDVSTYFTKKLLLGRKVGVNIDSKQKKSYGRVIAVVIVKGRNFNQILLREKLARILYFRNSEFNPYKWVPKSLYKVHTYGKKTFRKVKSKVKSKVKKVKSKGYTASMNGETYHIKNGCEAEHRIKERNKIYFSSTTKAVKAGYRACKNCF